MVPERWVEVVVVTQVSDEKDQHWGSASEDKEEMMDKGRIQEWNGLDFMPGEVDTGLVDWANTFVHGKIYQATFG